MKLLHAGREAAADEKPKEQVPQAAGGKQDLPLHCTAEEEEKEEGYGLESRGRGHE